MTNINIHDKIGTREKVRIMEVQLYRYIQLLMVVIKNKIMMTADLAMQSLFISTTSVCLFQHTSAARRDRELSRIPVKRQENKKTCPKLY